MGCAVREYFDFFFFFLLHGSKSDFICGSTSELLLFLGVCIMQIRVPQSFHLNLVIVLKPA